MSDAQALIDELREQGWDATHAMLPSNPVHCALWLLPWFSTRVISDTGHALRELEDAEDTAYMQALRARAEECERLVAVRLRALAPLDALHAAERLSHTRIDVTEMF